MNSWLQAVIKDNHIMVRSIDNKIQVRATAVLTNPVLPTFYSHRSFEQDNNRTEQNQDGTADVWEAMLVTEPMKFYNSTTKFKGWAKIELQPVKIGFDLAAMIKNIFKAMKERKKKMTINCSDGAYAVTNVQMDWLKHKGLLVDMSSYPMTPANTGYFNGTVTQLRAVLDTMPDGWTIPAAPPVIPPADPPADPPTIPVVNFEQTVLSKLDEIIGLLNQ